MKTAIVTSDESINHNTGDGHPENSERVSVVINNLKKNKKLIWKKAVKFDDAFLKLSLITSSP